MSLIHPCALWLHHWHCWGNRMYILYIYISHKICPIFCSDFLWLYCDLFCFGLLWVPSGFMQSIYPYSSGLLHWHRGSHMISQLAAKGPWKHYNDVIMGAMASQITSLTIVYSTVYSGGDQRKHPSSASLAFVWGINRWPVNSPYKWPVTRKIFPFDDVMMIRVKIGPCPTATKHNYKRQTCA